MSISPTVLASRVAAVGVTASQALTIVNEAIALIGVVENVCAGLKGEVKFQAVMSAMDQVIAQLGLTDKIDAIKRALGPIVNLVVAILNGAGLWASMFGSLISAAEAAVKPQPQPNAPDPAN